MQVTEILLLTLMALGAIVLLVRAFKPFPERQAAPSPISESFGLDRELPKSSTAKINYTYNEAGAHPWCELPDFSSEDQTRFTVPSMTERGLAYDVDLSNYSCTCPDWKKLRAVYAVRDFRRACKHIIALLLYRRAENLGDLLFAFLADLPAGVPTDCSWVMAQFDSYDVLFVLKGTSPWLDVVTAAPQPITPRPYQRFGFNLVEKRWAYGHRPRNAAIIRKIMKDLPMIREHYRRSIPA
jgi:hypothetical protein